MDVTKSPASSRRSAPPGVPRPAGASRSVEASHPAGSVGEEGRLQSAVRSAGCGVFWLDRNLTVQRTNAAFCRFAGRPAEALVGTPFPQLDPGWPHGPPDDAFNRLRGGDSASHATRLRRPDGSSRAVQIHLNALCFGGFESLFGVAVDTEARQAAEDALRISEARFRAVAEDQTEFIVRSAPDRTVTFCNPAYARLMGAARPEDLVGRPTRDLLREADVDRIGGLLASLTPDQPTTTVENRVPAAGDREVWVSWVVRALYESDGGEDGDDGESGDGGDAGGPPRVREYQSVGRDVTEDRAAERARAVAERRYRSLVEDSPDLISRWSPEGALTFANRAYREFFAVPNDAPDITCMLGERSVGSRASSERTIAALTPEEPVRQTVIAGRRADGETRQLEWVVRGLFDGGTLTEVQSVGRDATDRLEAEARLAERERRHRAVLDDLTEMVNRFRPEDGLITYGNRAFLEAKGDANAPVVGRMTIYDHLDEAAEEFARARFAAVTPEDPTVRVVLPLPGPGGTTRWEEWTNRALFAPHSPGERPVVLEFQSIGRDVTDELAARGRRREQRDAAAQLAKLTPRERQVLKAVTTGVTNKKIAGDLGIAERTVEKHRGAAMRRLGVRSAAELIRVVLLAEDSPDDRPPDDRTPTAHEPADRLPARNADRGDG